MGLTASLWVRTVGRILRGGMMTTIRIGRGTGAWLAPCRWSWCRWQSEGTCWGRTGFEPSYSNTSWPLPGQDVIDHAGGSCTPEHPMIVVRTAESAEQALTEGQLVCPRRGCGDTLARWGYGRRRHVVSATSVRTRSTCGPGGCAAPGARPPMCSCRLHCSHAGPTPPR
jgi:hypothetical protein